MISDIPLLVQIVFGFWILYFIVFLMVRGGRHARRILQGVEYTPIDELD